MAKSERLTPQEEIFIAAYVERPNATRAAQKAGYANDSAHVQGHRLLNRDKISNEITRRMRKITAKYNVTPERITAELAKIGFSNMADYTSITDDGDIVNDFTGVDRDQMAAISEIQVEEYTEGRGDGARNVKRTKFKLSDKRGALMDLAKLHNIGAANRTELTGADGGALAIAHTIDIKQLPSEEREKLKSVLLGIKARGNGQVTDVEPIDDEDGS